MAYQYQQCDDYFVMSDNDHREMVRRESAKEYEAHQKKQTQLRMAQRLSQIAKEEYGVEILRHMEEQEVCLRSVVTIIWSNDSVAQNLTGCGLHRHSE